MPAKKTKKPVKKKTIKKKVVKAKISKDMTISKVVAKYPETIEVFLEHGMGCLGCGIAQFETIEQGATAHGIDLKKLMDALNKMISKKK